MDQSLDIRPTNRAAGKGTGTSVVSNHTSEFGIPSLYLPRVLLIKGANPFEALRDFIGGRRPTVRETTPPSSTTVWAAAVDAAVEMNKVASAIQWIDAGRVPITHRPLCLIELLSTRLKSCHPQSRRIGHILRASPIRRYAFHIEIS